MFAVILSFDTVIITVCIGACCDVYHSLDDAGAVDCSKLYEPSLWLAAMLRESESPKAFYSASFKVWADCILRCDINISQESITAFCCCEVYLHLINEDPHDQLNLSPLIFFCVKIVQKF